MANFRHFFAMLWKNWLLKARNPIGSACELLLPLGFVLIMVGLYTQFDTVVTPDTSYVLPGPTGGALDVLPVSFLPARLALTNARLAVLASGPAGVPARDAFLAHVAATYGPFNGSTVGGGAGFSDPLLRRVTAPALSDVIVTFPSEDALRAYIVDPNYKADGYGPAIWAAIVFNADRPALDYAVRCNGSEVYNTRNQPVATLQRGADLETVRKYVQSEPFYPTGGLARPANVPPVLLQPFPGFTTLQLMVDRWAINRTLPLSRMDSTRVLQDLFAPALAYVLEANAGLSRAVAAEYALLNATGRLPAVAADILQWMRAEAMAPQQVTLIPFPVSGFQSNQFYTTVLPLFAFFFVIVVLFPVSRLIRGVVMEKEAKIREGMRMMGLTDASWYFSWVALYAAYFVVLAGLIALVTRGNFFSKSAGGVIWAFFFLFGLSCTSFAMLISVFFSKAKTASTLGVVLYLGGYFPFFALQPADISTGAKVLGALLAPTAFGLGVDLIGTMEDNGTGATVASSRAYINNWSLQFSFGMLIFDTLLYGVLAWYIDAVLPASLREFGVPRPLSFPFTAAYWREVLNLPPAPAAAPARRGVAAGGGAAASTSAGGGWWARARAALGLPPAPPGAGGSDASGLHNGPRADGSFFEEPDSDLQAREATGRAVQIRGLRKVFDTPDGPKLAVDDVDMTMYEGQIFVLLGHNGAGKTTTISMLTGLTEPTGGAMSVFGRDVASRLADVRKELGVCPQHDVLWPELTVKEHLQIFAAIKGVPPADVEGAIHKALKEVGLTEKLNYKSGALSGGQKRKLSVCIALCGGSRFILLDEPTSGMDPYSRRSTWQILQNAREGRVLLLTTHFMDEADILGDRICIMAHGQVRCAGSPTFLKRRYGVGYVLTLVKGGPAPCDADAVLALVRRHVPDAAVGSNVGAELALRLPLAASAAFAPMLAELDAAAPALGVAQYGMSVSDIQDVFLKIAEGREGEDAGAGAGAGPGAGGAGAGGGEVVAGAGGKAAGGSLGDKLGGDTLGGDTLVANPAADKGSDVRVAVSAATAGGKGASAPPPAPAPAPASSLAAVRDKARVVQSGWPTFRRHFGTLFLKRWQSARRDARAICYQLLIPVVMTLGGLLLLKANAFVDFPDVQLSTAVLNTGVCSARGGCNRAPAFPNYVPFTTFKSAPPGPARFDAPAVAALIRAIPEANATTSEARLTLSVAALSAVDAVDYYGFVQASTYPTRDWQRLSTFLLADRPAYAASKYLAYMPTGACPGYARVAAQPPDATLPTDDALTVAAFHNTTWRYSGPTALNLITSSAFAAVTGGAGSIATRQHPLPYTLRQNNLISAFFTFSAAVIMVMAFAFFPASVAIFVTKEREVSAKHQQLISGVSISAYWLSNYAFDLLTFVVPAGVSIGLAKAFAIKEFTDADVSRVNAFVALFALYGTSVTPFTYVVSFAFKSHSSAQNVSLIIGIVSLILMIASTIMSQVQSTCVADKSLRFVWRLLPGFDLGNGLLSLSFLAQLPLIDSTCDAYQGVVRPASFYTPYDAFNLSATGYNLIYMAVLSPAYLALAVAIDVAMAQPAFRLALSGKPENVADIPEVEDEDVAAERARVAAVAAGGGGGGGGGGGSDVVLLKSLRKVYAGGKVAVKNLSFGMPAGEVFGFLGINGAGKTTTLQMLSGDVLPSAGTATLGGFDIIRQQPEVRRLLGYCPQHEALLENLTAREHLEMYARIKGVPEADVPAVVAASIAAMDLGPFAGKLAVRLSGGNKRKLSVAIALIGSPPIVFLDEPSTGMDPVAKRFMWKVISRVATEDKLCSIILTTHSMEEVEALCTRIGIMVGGRLRCLGSSQHLKSRHGSGFVSEVRRSPPAPAEVDAVAAAVDAAAKAAGHGLRPGWLPRAAVDAVAAALGAPARAAELHEAGSGWAVAASFAASSVLAADAPAATKCVASREFAAWWAAEAAAAALEAYMAASFPGVEVVERQGAVTRFAIPALGRLGDMFSRLEATRAPRGAGGAGVESYTLGQTSLEQIFIAFAGQQAEETAVARGVVLRAVDSAPRGGDGPGAGDARGAAVVVASPLPRA